MTEIELDAFGLFEGDGAITKAKWQNCTMASFEALKEAASGNAKAFVWRDEGEFKGQTWHFNKDHAGKFEPLLIDKISADMLMAAHSALEKSENRLKFEEWMGKSRGHFGAIWELTERTVKITGFSSR